MTKTCHNCGLKWNDTAIYCGKCGNLLQKQDTQSIQRGSRASKPRFLLWVLYVLFAAAVGSLVWYFARPLVQCPQKQLIRVVRTRENHLDTYNFSYDEAGNVIKIEGTSVSYGREYPFLQEMVYDSEGRLIEIWDRANGMSVPNAENNGWEEVPLCKFEYDTQGNLIYDVHSFFYKTEYVHDEHGNLIKTYYPHDIGKTTIYHEYDEQGKLLSSVRCEEYDDTRFPNETTYTKYAYNHDGLLTEERSCCKYEDGTEKSWAYTYTYDSQGRQLSKTKVGSDKPEMLYCYDYPPFTMASYWDESDNVYNTTLRIFNRENREVWGCYQVFNPQYTVDKDGYIIRIQENGLNGDGSTIEFFYEDK